MLLFLACPSASYSVGLKRRLAEAEAADSEAAASADAGSTGASSSDARDISEAGPFLRGIRQRLAALSDLDSQDRPRTAAHGPLYKSLVRDWAKGKIVSSQVQEYAWGAAHQGAEGIDRMGSIGAAGAHPQNMMRALKALLGMPRGSPSFTWIELPLKSGRVPHPVLLPHEFSSFSRNVMTAGSKLSLGLKVHLPKFGRCCLVLPSSGSIRICRAASGAKFYRWECMEMQEHILKAIVFTR